MDIESDVKLGSCLSSLSLWWLILIEVQGEMGIEMNAQEPTDVAGAILTVGVQESSISKAVNLAIRILAEFDLAVGGSEDSIHQIEVYRSSEDAIRSSMGICIESESFGKYYRSGIAYYRNDPPTIP